MILLMVLVMLTGCAKAPGAQENSKTMIDPESTHELRQMLILTEYDNMNVSPNVIIDYPQTAYSSNAVIADGFEEKYKELFTHYLPEGAYDEDKVYTIENAYPYGANYDDNELGISMSVGCTGYFFLSVNFDTDKYFTEQKEIIKSYEYFDGASCSDSFMLSDGEMTVNEAAKTAQEIADDFIKTSDYKNSLNVSRITVMKNDSGEQFFSIDYSEQIGVVDLFNRYSHFNNELSFENILSNISLQIAGENSYVFVTEAEFLPYGTVTEYTPSGLLEAADKVSGELSGYLELNLQRVSFEYMAVPINENTGASIVSGNIFELKPCWVFYFDDTKDREAFAVYYADSGEVDFVDNAG